VQKDILGRIETTFAVFDRLVAEAAAARRLLDRLDQAILSKAFRGELVQQDPADEPASVLLDRIRAEREAAPAKSRRGRRAAAA
jgi:type I restriction enzyme S subunit